MTYVLFFELFSSFSQFIWNQRQEIEKTKWKTKFEKYWKVIANKNMINNLALSLCIGKRTNILLTIIFIHKSIKRDIIWI